MLLARHHSVCTQSYVFKNGRERSTLRENTATYDDDRMFGMASRVITSLSAAPIMNYVDKRVNPC